MASGTAFEEKIRLYVEATGDKEIGALAAQLSKLAAGSDQAAAHAQQLVAELDRLTSLQNNIRQFTTLKAAMTETAGAMDRARQRMAEINAEVDRAGAPTEKLRRQQASAAAEVTNLTRAYNRQQAEFTRANNALQHAGIDTQRLGSAYADLQAQVGSLGQRAGDAAGALRSAGAEGENAAGGLLKMATGASSGAEALGAVVTSLGAMSSVAGAALAGLAALGGGALLTGALQSATTLEDALVQVKAVTGASADEMERMKAAAENAAATTRFSALEAAQGLGELARATGTAEDAIAALPATLSLAQAAGLGVAEAATIMTTTLTSFRLGMDQTTHVADLFAREANSTQDTVEGLGNAMSYAAPLAAQLGMSIEDTTALIGALAKEGFRGERAGTALRNALSALNNPASEFSKTLRDAGVESSNFSDVVFALASDSTLAQRALLTLDAEARPAISSLVSKGAASLHELQSALHSAGGEAERTAAQMGNSTTAAAQQVSKGFDQIRRELVEPLLQPLQGELAKLTNQLVAFSKTPEFARIRESLTSIFQTGIEAAERFAAEIDWDDLLTGFVGFAETTATALEDLLPLVTSAADEINATVDAFKAGFFAMEGVVNAAAAQITGALSTLAAGFDMLTAPERKLLELVGILDKGSLDFSGFAGRMAAASVGFSKAANDSFSSAADAATEYSEDVAKAGQHAAGGVDAVGKASKGAAGAVREVAAAATAAADGLTKQGDAAESAADRTDRAARKMAITAEQVRNAFADLGVKSQDDLDRAAAAAKRNFELIRAAVGEGKATAEDARRAYAAYAEAARAAVADSDSSKKTRVDAELSVQAAVTGVTSALKEQGSAGTNAAQQIAQGASQAASAYQGVAEASQSAGDNVQWLSNNTTSASQAMQHGASAAQGFGLVLGDVSEAFTRAALGANRFVNSVNTERFARQLNAVTDEYRRQQEILNEQQRAIDRQIASYDPLTRRVEQLRSQFTYLGEAQLRGLAQSQQQLDELVRRQQETAQRATEQTTQQAAAQSGPARAVGAGGATAAASGAGLRDFGTIRVELPDGSSGQIVTDADGAAMVRGLIDQLTRSRANGPRGRR